MEANSGLKTQNVVRNVSPSKSLITNWNVCGHVQKFLRNLSCRDFLWEKDLPVKWLMGLIVRVWEHFTIYILTKNLPFWLPTNLQLLEMCQLMCFLLTSLDVTGNLSARQQQSMDSSYHDQLCYWVMIKNIQNDSNNSLSNMSDSKWMIKTSMYFINLSYELLSFDALAVCQVRVITCTHIVFLNEFWYYFYVIFKGIQRE